MQVDGACLCGDVTFEAEIDPARVFACHCSDCQTQCGAFRTIVLANPGSFRLASGRLEVYEKRAESGSLRALAFCPVCGTSIYGGPVGDESGALSLRVGVVRQRAELRPAVQVWCRSEQPWLESLSAVPRLDTQPGVPSGTEA